MEALGSDRRNTYVLAGVLLVVLGVFPFVMGTRVPILGFVDLAVHEAGHVLFIWAPDEVMLAMGNGFQALVPLAFAFTFAVKHRDLAGASVALAWSAAALQDASVYIADAPYRRLPLLGPEDSHDWWQLLGSKGMLAEADDFAKLALLAGGMVFLLALTVFAVGLRWDNEWRDGASGALYWPWDREVVEDEPVPVAAGPRSTDNDPWASGRVVW